MSGFENLEKSIKKKLTLQDSNTAIPQNVNTAKQHKCTYYLDDESLIKFNKLCSKNIITNGKVDKSGLICKAIDLLYQKEGTQN